tara:strand:+ start:167 stop:1684 length:1518 start_codon:yes stop_codon:yes gene_type:complete
MVNSALIGRRTTISASAFTGRAVAPGAVTQPDPTTTALINKNSLQLGVVSNQIQNLTAQVNSLSGSMTVIANSLATSQALERRKEQQEILLERRLAEQQLREGKESAIEKKIQAKTIAPAEKISGRAQVTLGRLGNFFFTLLGGWLAVNAIKVLNALSEGNTKELRRLQDKIVSNLVKIGSVMLAGKAALALITLRFKAFAILAAGAAVANYFSDPIAQFINVVTEAAKRGVVGLLRLFKLAPEEDSTKPPSDVDSGNNTTLPDITPAPDTEDAIGDEQSQTEEPPTEEPPPIEGIDPTAPPDDLSGTGGPSLDPNVQPVTPVMGREPMSADQLKGNEVEQEAPVNPDVPAEYGETEMTVNVEDVSIEGDTGAGNVPIEGDPSAGLEPGQMTQGDTTFTQMGTSAAEVQSFIEQERYIGRTGQLSPDMITPVKRDDSVAQTISRSTEPGVTVVPIPIEQAQAQQTQPVETPAAQGTVSGVPNIPTSNADNIYLLGAYSNFNVVPS